MEKAPRKETRLEGRYSQIWESTRYCSGIWSRLENNKNPTGILIAATLFLVHSARKMQTQHWRMAAARLKHMFDYLKAAVPIKVCNDFQQIGRKDMHSFL